MPPNQSNVGTIEILAQPHAPDNGVIVVGEDCFPGDIVTCDINTARYLVATGRAKYTEEPTPEAPTPVTFQRRSPGHGPTVRTAADRGSLEGDEGETPPAPAGKKR